ncbi:response regulator [Paenibacillus sp. sgz500992]|uniref:response regulator n=1 Tax=Paenibacillus sp. sgz500992 TaxID=3242476 RepID=UPI0036D3DEAA
MHTLMLVEDELIEMELLEQYVPWHEMGITLVGSARNGQEALRKLDSLSPDIVLTDVRMPLMDGLEFARQIRLMNKNIKIIFLSGHNEFQYIKAALTVEAVGYLLKPIDMDELRELIITVKQKCEEDTITHQNLAAAKDRLLLKWLTEKDENLSRQWEAQLFRLPLPLPEQACYIAAYVTVDGEYGQQPPELASASLLVAGLQKRIELTADHVTSVETGEYSLGLIVMSHTPIPELAHKSFWRNLLSSIPEPYPSASVTIGLSDAGVSVQELPHLFWMAQQRNEWKFFLGTGKVIDGGDRMEPVHTDLKPEAYASELCRALADTDERKAGGIIAEYADILRSTGVGKNSVITQLLGLLTGVEHEFASLLASAGELQLFSNHWERLSQLLTIGDMQQYLLDICAEMISMLRTRAGSPAQKLLTRIDELIQDRFSTPLTVEEIAREVFLSPNYVRTLYKEATGETILEAITRTRIEHATRLLGDKALKIHQISRAAGYESVSYFCSVFLKHKGCSPNEYRKKFIL